MRNLFLNLQAGFRLATLFRVHSTDFRVSIRQLVWLLLIEFALGLGISHAMLEGAGSFNPYVVVQALASVTLTLAVAALLAAWLRAPALLLGYAVAATAMAPSRSLSGMPGFFSRGRLSVFRLWVTPMASTMTKWSLVIFAEGDTFFRSSK